MTDKQFEDLVKHIDTHHLELRTDIAELDAKLDSKADAPDIDVYRTTLGLDTSKGGKA